MARTFFMARSRASTLALLRVMTGLMFMQHGVQKLLGWLVRPARRAGHTAGADVAGGLAGVLKVFGGVLLAWACLTPAGGVPALGDYGVGVLPGARARGFWPILNGGELAALYCFSSVSFPPRRRPLQHRRAMERRTPNLSRMDFAR